MILAKTAFIVSLLAAQAHAACTRIDEARGNSLQQVEPCPVERDANGIPTGRYFCSNSNAWLRNGWNWGSRVTSPDNNVIFRIIPSTETGPLTDEPIYYSCQAGTNDEFVWTRDYTFGTYEASVVA
ncbi:hypothetical protein F5X68DRAFT_193205 [Plectosphaerella plurivora]|uniref:Ig-like domain-containing protein n=1 Tax=Plectosphaerella plurivora TaxID=936078 RepID=A0A9P9A8V9_9PEZI|nr:hypothetical protein F5X68DRAFT_193205 [Plectosphaerella plurivora]